MIKKLLAVLLIWFGFAALASEAAAERVLRFGVFLPPKAVNVREAFAPWAERVNERAEGEVKIEVFTGGAMGRSGKMQYELVRRGVLDITFVVPGYTPGQFPSDSLFEMPVYTTDTMEISLVLWRLFEKGLLPGYDDEKILALYVGSPSYLHLDFPYESVDDLKGKKIRTVSFYQTRLMDSVGATPIGGITATQIAESISRGLIDGALFNWYTARPLGLTQAADYHTTMPLAYTPGFIVMRRATFESLSPRMQRIIEEESGVPFVKSIVQAMENEAHTHREAARKDEGRVFVEPSPEDRKKWRAKIDEQLEAWVDSTPNGEALLKAYRETLAEIRREQAANGPAM